MTTYPCGYGQPELDFGSRIKKLEKKMFNQEEDEVGEQRI